MTLIHYDTPLIRSDRAPAPATRLAQRLVRSLGDALTHLAAARRLRREQRALESLPFALRKDIGWPAGDIDRR